MRNIFSTLFTISAILISIQSTAQTQPLSDAKIRTNLSQVRFLVNAPAGLSGLKKATIASWGGQANPALLNVPVVRGVDSLAVNPLTNASAIAGKVCLLFRGGGITFAQKAQYAVAAGAIGVIVVNNVSGDPIAMGNTGTATYTVPIVMITSNDGVALNNSIIAGTPVNVSIGSWNLSVTHDLAILPGYQSVPHALNIPYSQLSVGASRLPYQNFVGGAVLNYGTSAETGLTISDTVKWVPTGGASSTVHTGSYSVPNIASSDSVKFGFGPNSAAWSLTAPTSTGYYSYNYALTYANTDQIPQDNSYTFNQYVTDSVFCKGLYDYSKNQPYIGSGIQPASVTTGYSMGPLYYVANGKYAARKMQFSVSKNTVPTLDGEEAYALLFKWVDGSNGQPLDSFVEGDELKLAGVTRKVFTTADSSGAVFTVNVTDPVNSKRNVILDSNSWYWASVQATSTCFIGVDQTVSFFTRSYIQSKQTGYVDQPELLFVGDYNDLSTATSALLPFPFGGNAYDIDSTFFDRFYYIPNVALHISKNQTTANAGVENLLSGEIGKLSVFPVPSSASISVDIHLNSTSSVGKVEYRLLDVSGKLVYKADRAGSSHDVFTIPSANIPSGIYYLAAFTGDGQLTQKVVVRH